MSGGCDNRRTTAPVRKRVIMQDARDDDDLHLLQSASLQCVVAIATLPRTQASTRHATQVRAALMATTTPTTRVTTMRTDAATRKWRPPQKKKKTVAIVIAQTAHVVQS